MSFTTRRLPTDSSSQYRIPNSLRFRSSASAYLSRTQLTGNPNIFTLSFWIKRGSKINRNQEEYILTGTAATSPTIRQTAFQFTTADTIAFAIDSAVGGIAQTTAVFRDSSAWYHVVFSYDSSRSLGQRAQVYVNGSGNLFTSDTTNGTSYWNTAGSQFEIGRNLSVAPFIANRELDGYLTEVNFIDGQALDPLAFGRIDSKTGVWTPSKYTGTYGTNGFYLKFTDNSAATAAAIGKDFSGNGNNWTPNNISLTAGATYDSMIDTPTPYDDGGYGRGNYATLNPLINSATTSVPINVTNGNLSVAATNSGGIFSIPDNIPFYFEIETPNNYGFLIKTANNPTAESSILFGISCGYNSTSFPDSYYYRQQFRFGTGTIDNTNPGGNQIREGNFGLAINKNAGTLRIYHNGVLIGSATIDNPSQIDAFEIRQNTTTLGSGGYTQKNINFGQRPFAYTPPTGFKTLCTQNLPTPAIVNPALYMAATTYAGTGATQTIANTVNNKSFQPDLVWIKGRSAATDHALYDSVRGATKDLVSNSTSAETTQANGLTTFGSNGFTVGSLGKLNTSAQTYVAWQWKAGDSTVTNTAGSITSQVDANPTAGFSIVSYTGTGVNATVGHGLGVAPKMIIVKSRSATSSLGWEVYHASLGASARIELNAASAQTTGSSIWNNTAPTSSVFTISNETMNNQSGVTFVAYCFAEVDGFSKFGSYTGNGSADGVFCYTGFRPKWVMIKRTDLNVTNWQVWDIARLPFNVAGTVLVPNNTDIDTTGSDIDIISNGFKLRMSFPSLNASGGTYIFAAFAEASFKYALAR